MKKLIKSLILAIAPLFVLSAPALAATNPLDDVCSQPNAKNSSICQQAGAVNNSSDNPVAKTLHTAANIIAMVASVIAVIMIIVSGLTMVTSQGNPDAVKSSRNRIIYSVVGIVMIALAWSITTFVVNRL